MTDEEKRKRACENSRKYYQAHKEEILSKQYVYKKKKYKEDPEYRKKVYENSRRWIEKNPEKAYAIKRKWQVEHREPTKDEIIERLQEEIMWLKDTIADREDYIFHLECLVEDREKAIDKAVEKTILWGEILDKDFQKELLDILRGDE